MAIKKELRKQRIILVAVLLFSSISLILAFSMFLDVRMSDFGRMIHTQDVRYTNASTVYIPENYVQIWNDRYKSERTEFLYCLYGVMDDDKFVITDMRTTDILSYSESSISYIPCEKNRHYLGNIHSHPQPSNRYEKVSCRLSQRDIFTFGKERQALTGVICGENEIAIYGINDLQTSFQIRIMENKK